MAWCPNGCDQARHLSMDPTTGLSPAVLPLRLAESPSGPRSGKGAAHPGPKVASPLPRSGGLAAQPRSPTEPKSTAESQSALSAFARLPDHTRHGSRLLDAEVVSDGVHVQEPKDEQRDGDHADECAHDQEEEPQPVGREAWRATCPPPRLCVPRKRFGSHLTGSYAGHALRLSLDIRVGASPVGLGVVPLSIGIATTSL